jgi:hypothetical protein
MFAQRFQVTVRMDGEERPCPLEWLDAFCMRNFTGSAEFDDTLPIADGQLEASFRVDPQRFATALAEFLTRRGKAGGKPVSVFISRKT